MSYEAPFAITNEMLSLVANISEKIGLITHYESLSKLPKLRRQNRILSVYSSCAIEANSLSLNQVRDIINGKIVLGPKKEIQEVKNAIDAYECIEKINPYKMSDLLKIHKIMSMFLVDNPGKFRLGEEGVFDEDICIFVAPPANFVPQLMSDLFEWMNENKDKIHPLIISSIFHYEFVFIHPFTDCNGRTARFMQSAFLGLFNPIFYWLPIENYIKYYQEDYYQSISASHNEGESTKFILFMLKMILKTIEDVTEQIHIHENHLSEYVKNLLSAMENDIYMTANEIMGKLNLKSKETFRKNYMNPAIGAGLVELEFPDKPTSKKQRYIKK